MEHAMNPKDADIDGLRRQVHAYWKLAIFKPIYHLGISMYPK